MSIFHHKSLKETKYHTKRKNKYSNYNDIGKDDTIQVLQPYFHSGPYIYIYKHKSMK